MTQAPKQKSTWITITTLPEPLKTSEFLTEPLAEKHAALDFEAVMSCRARLREELQWGDWPPDKFNVDWNRTDLLGHHEEFIQRKAFAYAVLSLKPCEVPRMYLPETLR